MTTNQIRWQEHLENKRRNLTSEQHARDVLQEETRRHDQTFSETVRSNVAKETEQHRTNLANELIKQEANSLTAMQHKETTRHNKQLEALDSAKTVEAKRHNIASEAINETANAIKQQEADTHEAAADAQAERYQVQNLADYQNMDIRERDIKVRERQVDIDERYKKSQIQQNWVHTAIDIAGTVGNVAKTINGLGFIKKLIK